MSGQTPEWRVTGRTARGSIVTADRTFRSAAEAEAAAMRDEGLADVRIEPRTPSAPDTARTPDQQERDMLERRLLHADAEVADLRSEAAALRDAGNTLAAATEELLSATHDVGDETQQAAERVVTWRSAAGTPTTDNEET